MRGFLKATLRLRLRVEVRERESESYSKDWAIKKREKSCSLLGVGVGGDATTERWRAAKIHVSRKN